MKLKVDGRPSTKNNERVVRMSKKLISYMVAGAMALGLIGGATYQGIAKAQTSPSTPPAVTATKAATSNDQQNVEEQQPVYQGTIKVANPQDNGKGSEAVKDNEAQESAQLSSLTKITPDEAKAAALKVVPGTVEKVSLDNENGYLVYSVEIKTNSGVIDVKVDAGNGAVLDQDKG
ncbi:MAG: Peptidase propeptide and YPEB domain protein [Caldanaerobacter subterraneus]|uniref:PepSY domain-containing protein n=1 Tax=Caldanaerobacter subterraneus TaxID=911092 RepID=UPI000748C36C|nr:PepSY domain-containing protein [Caldanaerobacter subterraneus]KUK07969.1 MAG: Peptidase propeptide and YPEB domain protein [Caldanaerobacter subterraneus]